MGEGLSVPVTERVILRDVVSEIVPELHCVGRRDAGTVKAGDGVILRDFVRVTETVRERVILTERVKLPDTVGLIDRVKGILDAIGEPLLVSEFEPVRLSVTVELIDLVNGHVVGIGEGLRVTVFERVRL
jgi:hypothetical protein